MRAQVRSPASFPLRIAARLACAPLAAALLAGCLTRVLEIRSDPPGAQAYVNGRLVGTTPAEYTFDHYGDRTLVLALDRHATVSETIDLTAPWWACFPCDLFVELWPGRVVDRHEKTVTLARNPGADAELEELFRNLGTAQHALHAEEQ
ncbi:MAG TPA: PEGA domain-containing protein [Planctomycetota bacterium]|jgi:hypothetical protein|nr:MAG: PEGA domain protein [Planctomycetes bacterium ADurb.Bin069]HNS00279.1 PEGA domain-containing protein [Planctomycetota bacterium]HNU27443.1 PEGA domain-containing protein [Planctomycetota bacterium]HOE31023.1 PEGA domain-containing protein [Planctomycetota bacterium]HOE86872.1 PEGA domain-containing protein [Planctomycetota bacterium]